jgi:hypothetical protein
MGGLSIEWIKKSKNWGLPSLSQLKTIFSGGSDTLNSDYYLSNELSSDKQTTKAINKDLNEKSMNTDGSGQLLGVKVFKLTDFYYDLIPITGSTKQVKSYRVKSWRYT